MSLIRVQHSCGHLRGYFVSRMHPEELVLKEIKTKEQALCLDCLALEERNSDLTEPLGPLTFERLREANTSRLWNIHREEHDEHRWTPNDWAVATAGELGEALNKLKKRRRGDSIPVAEIAAELADTVIYLDLLADSLDIDLGEAVRDKFNVVSARYGIDLKL